VLGLGPRDGDEVPGVRRRPVSGTLRGWSGSLRSALPAVTHAPASQAYRAAVADVLAERTWDAVVIDHLQMAWVAQAHPRLGTRRDGPPLVFVTHNHESTVRTAAAAEYPLWTPRGLVLRIDSRKAARLEAATVAAADLVTTITESDAHAFRTGAGPGRSIPGHVVVLPPGYEDPSVVPVPAARRARRVVMVGSFEWHVKAANLRQFVLAADPVLAAAGVELVVVGRVPEPVLERLRPHLRATRFAGWVDDLATELGDARLAVVDEPVGGGFKMKTLDYIFHHVPVAATVGSAEGLGADGCLLQAPDAVSLARLLVAVVDDTDRLDALAAAAYRWAKRHFDWARSGERLAETLDDALVA
jgi:glycosyltransferase involved in cell wall biosynthesis